MVLKSGIPFCLFVLVLVAATTSSTVNVDLGRTGRTYQGVGGLSGGGATSLLLSAYPKEQLSEIYDYLFLPKFGASLDIIKVEIGSDAQSTDGGEACYSRSEDDINWNRGYEWEILRQAKLRNPHITTVGLPWGFPAWVGEGSNPYAYPNKTALWIAKWVKGAFDKHDIVIDYVGVWNERPYNITYIKTLRSVLDSFGLQHTRIIAADGDFGQISKDILADHELAEAVDVIGAHYPGTYSSPEAVQTNKHLWASEDYSTYANYVGGGCWARLLNQNYVNGNMTSTISWNLVASYYTGLPFWGDGLMMAMSPWSGNYEVSPPIWISAHTTQFTEVGWKYIQHGFGSGHLPKGGSYVTLVNTGHGEGDADANANALVDFTIVIETMTHDSSICIRPKLPEYTVSADTLTFKVTGFGDDSISISTLHLWESHVAMEEKGGFYFKYQRDITVNDDGEFELSVEPDHVYTVSTISDAAHGQHPSPPPVKPFPLPYSDDFSAYPIDSEAVLFADQTGSWEIQSVSLPLPVESKTGSEAEAITMMQQVVKDPPIVWCDEAPYPITIIGDRNWTDITASARMVTLEDGAWTGLAVRVEGGGCNWSGAHEGEKRGLYFWINPSSDCEWQASIDVGRKHVIHKGACPSSIAVGEAFLVKLTAVEHSLGLRTIQGHINGDKVFESHDLEIPSHGWVGVLSSWHNTAFDQFEMS